MAVEKLFILACCVLGVLAFPQVISLDKDAERIPTRNTGSDPDGAPVGDGPVILLVPRFRPFRPRFGDDDFPPFFTRRRPISPIFPDFDSSNSTANSTRSVPNFITCLLVGCQTPDLQPDDQGLDANSTSDGVGVFTRLFGFLNPFQPANPLPPSDSNSTYEVDFKGNHKIETNKTVGTYDDGSTFTHIVMRLSPHDEGTEGGVVDEETAVEGTEDGIPAGEVPSGNPEDNQIATSVPVKRSKRYSVFRPYRRRTPYWSRPWPRPRPPILVGDSNWNQPRLPSPVGDSNRPKPRPPTLVGDTNVNNFRFMPTIDPDAEVFDLDLILNARNDGIPRTHS